jgi:hypothetical protein
MPPWYGRPQSACVRRCAADGPTVCGAHPAGYGADGGARGPGETSRSLGARAHGEGARLGRHAGADTEAVGARARATSRRGGALARQRVDVLVFEHEYLQKFD